MSDYAHLFIIGVAAVLAVSAFVAIMLGLYVVALVQPWALFVAVPVAALLVGALVAGVAWVGDL